MALVAILSPQSCLPVLQLFKHEISFPADLTSLLTSVSLYEVNGIHSYTSV